jgi:hypothetical protein
MLEDGGSYMVANGPYPDGNWTTINEKFTLVALHFTDQ